jgi:hypothetical protein
VASSGGQKASNGPVYGRAKSSSPLDQHRLSDPLSKSLFSTTRFSSVQMGKNPPLMRQIPKTELSPDNGCIIDMKWQLGPLSYHASAAGKEEVPFVMQLVRLPELVLYDHTGFKGAFARTNLSFHYLGDYWNDRISCLIVVSGVWRFYRDDYYKGPYWDLGPGYYESFFSEKGPDDVVSSFQCIALT